jgi:hypothetical protein
MQRLYKQKGIGLVLNYPISDVKEEEYMEQLFEASKHLFDLIDRKQEQVFMHCSAGASRGPTLAMVYLAIFLKHKYWNNIPELQKWIKANYYMSLANIDIVLKVIERNREFQSKQKLNYEDEEERRRRAAEEAERLRQLKLAQDEAERIRLLRLAEAEREKLRLQREQHEQAERERLRKIKMQEEEDERLRRLAEERARLEAKKLEDEKAQHELERRLREEEAEREAERIRLQQEAEIQAERLRAQQLAIEAAREEAKLKKEREEREEEER